MLLEDGAGVTDARLHYRRDIDGLRGVAVLLVMGSHLGVQGFSGGYIGVDIFFVISGYLISSIIFPQIAEGTFSFRAFYLRRLRRIYPALLAMLLATAALAWHYLLPYDMRLLGPQLRASTFGYSNLVVSDTTGYFDSIRRFWPLMHTWSLGVEEQFYLLLPTTLMVGVWVVKPRRVGIWIAVLALTSFVASCVMVQWKQGAAFYRPQFRAWELLMGVWIAQPGFPKLRMPWHRHIASLIGVGLIVFCLWQYGPLTLFPGLAALPVCAGAALLIAAGETGTSAVGALLEVRPIVFVGLISYSLYLWHWPVQVFWDFQHLLTLPEQESLRSRAFITVVSFVIATFSWRYIELPFRRRGAIATGEVLLLIGASMALLAAYAHGISTHHGYPSRWPAKAVRLSNMTDMSANADPGRWGVCELTGNAQSPLLWLKGTSAQSRIHAAECLPFTPGRHHYLLVGDSHAAMLWWGLSHTFPDLQIGQAGAAMCGTYKKDSLYSDDPTCAGVEHLIYDDLIPNHNVDTIIFSYYWELNRISQVTEAIAYAKRYGVEVIVVGPTDTYVSSVPRQLAVASLRDVDPVHLRTFSWIRWLDPQMKALAHDVWKVKYISIYDQVCGGPYKECPVYTKEEAPFLWDSHHFSPQGSIAVAESIRDHHQLP